MHPRAVAHPTRTNPNPCSLMPRLQLTHPQGFWPGREGENAACDKLLLVYSIIILLYCIRYLGRKELNRNHATVRVGTPGDLGAPQRPGERRQSMLCRSRRGHATQRSVSGGRESGAWLVAVSRYHTIQYNTPSKNRQHTAH